VLTYFLGPFLAFFPKRWRESLPASSSVNWRYAAVLSGLAESVLALVAMVYWYSYSMVTWVGQAMDKTLTGDMPTGVNEQEVGLAAVMIFATHPLTWLIGYFGVEGAVRMLGAAVSENTLGVFPLYLVARAISRFTGRGAKSRDSAPNILASAKSAVRTKLALSILPRVPDELRVTRNESEEILEIRACRPKEDWVPPRVVRYGDIYYRLEETSKGTASRPFSYLLRRLPAGVPGRSVLLYQPETEPSKENW
jgi:hypothetical protein